VNDARAWTPARDGLRVAGVATAPGSAAQLASLRIVVPAMILLTAELRHAPELAAVPRALLVAPEGLGWFVAHVPISPALATFAQAVCVFASLCAIAGVWARPAMAVVTLTAFYTFSLSQLAGAVWHDMHLLWMAALLAASPCDEALAYDRRGEPRPRDSSRYGVPLFFARVLLSCVYFFPGLHKLLRSGLAWALSDNLRNQLWWKWAEHGVVPTWRIDEVPLFLQASGLFVLAFELGFPLLALTRRGRPWAAALGIAFHLTAGALFRIPFVSLWATYVVLVDVPGWFARLRKTPSVAAAGPDGPVLRSTLVAGGLLVAGAAVQGARGEMRSYPFASYPTFEWMASTEMPDLRIEVDAPGQPGQAEQPREEWVVVPHARDSAGYRTQRQWGEIWSLAGVTAPVDADRLAAYLGLVARREPARSIVRQATRARFFRAYVSVVPERREDPPRVGPLLAEVALPRPSRPSPPEQDDSPRGTRR
jgi:Vitamin K-dependent gamma-carboxylase